MSAYLGKEKIAPATMPEKYDPDTKQDKLESGVNIKTINGESLLGEGDIVVENQNGVTLDTDQTITGKKTFVKPVVVTGDEENAQTAKDACGKLTVYGLMGSVEIRPNDKMFQTLCFNSADGPLYISVDGIERNGALLEYPDEGGTLATEEKVEGKLDRQDNQSYYYDCPQVYAVDTDHVQILMNTDSDEQETTTFGALVRRWNYGDIYVHLEPHSPKSATSKNYVDNLVGDIESALDSIIAIQNSLIGGNE